MSELDIGALRKIAVRHIRKKVHRSFTEPEDIVHNAIVSLLKTKSDMSLLCRKSSFQLIDDLRSKTKYHRTKKTCVKVIQSTECLKQIESISSKNSYQEIKEDDLLDFKINYNLSDAEIKIASMLVDQSPEEISKSLGVDINKVRRHIYNLRKKISVLNPSRKTA